MSVKTGIEWTDSTWNPVRGCSRVSRGCENCYAERVAGRFSDEGFPFHGFARRYAGSDRAEHARATEGRWTGKVELVEKHLEDPLRWKAPRRVFVNSMSDLFHEKLSIEDVARVFSVMERCPQHTFQVLTKRAELMRGFARLHKVLPNVWLGVSIEDQKTADERIPLLLEAPAARRFVSAEPLLGPVELFRYLAPAYRAHWTRGYDPDVDDHAALAQLARAAMRRQFGDAPFLDWVIVGGESGPGARPFALSWARTVLAECRAAGVPAFMKQVGSRPEGDFAELATMTGERLASSKGGDPSEWPEDLRVREFPS
ncbi:MAG: phage Gp37/Gp68 family protein [Acidobacteriota bacterium]|nr:phage Gp37/Gp68 family protein [Acidobacteriota bacterium]MDQ6892244.1 phage Gp37/Gp68 family protein [Acidobacteriota bacterium]